MCAGSGCLFDPEWTSAVRDLTASAAVVGGAIWAAFKFGLFRLGRVKVEIAAEIKLISRGDEDILVQLLATVSNKGAVRCSSKRFSFSLFGLERGAPFVQDGALNGTIRFNPIKRRHSWVPWHTFVDPGVTQTYSYLTSVPKSMSVLLLHLYLIHDDAKAGVDDYTAQAVLDVSEPRTAGAREIAL